jgi:hypothetical protein
LPVTGVDPLALVMVVVGLLVFSVPMVIVGRRGR